MADNKTEISLLSIDAAENMFRTVDGGLFGLVLMPFVDNDDIIDAISNSRVACVIFSELDAERLRNKYPQFAVVDRDFMSFDTSGVPRADFVILTPPVGNELEYIKKSVNLLSISGRLIAIVRCESIIENRELLQYVFDNMGAVIKVGGIYDQNKEQSFVIVYIDNMTSIRQIDIF